MVFYQASRNIRPARQSKQERRCPANPARPRPSLFYHHLECDVSQWKADEIDRVARGWLPPCEDEDAVVELEIGHLRICELVAVEGQYQSEQSSVLDHSLMLKALWRIFGEEQHINVGLINVVGDHQRSGPQRGRVSDRRTEPILEVIGRQARIIAEVEVEEFCTLHQHH